jgi:FixJ family two-component response regulator
MNQKQTVFVVDDEQPVLKAISRLLRAEGYTTRAFGSAQEFMDHYKPGAAGCLLLDLSMPGITGQDLQRWLADSCDPLPILFLTASEDIPEGDRATLRGAVKVLMKPVVASVLIAGIEEALARDRQARNGSGA